MSSCPGDDNPRYIAYIIQPNTYYHHHLGILLTLFFILSLFGPCAPGSLDPIEEDLYATRNAFLFQIVCELKIHLSHFESFFNSFCCFSFILRFHFRYSICFCVFCFLFDSMCYLLSCCCSCFIFHCVFCFHSSSHLKLAYFLHETNPFPELVVNFPDYALRISLGTFAILLCVSTLRLCCLCMFLLCNDVKKCQAEGFDRQDFIRTDNKLIILLHILLFGLTMYSKSAKMTGMSKKISSSPIVVFCCQSL